MRDLVPNCNSTVQYPRRFTGTKEITVNGDELSGLAAPDRPARYGRQPDTHCEMSSADDMPGDKPSVDDTVVTRAAHLLIQRYGDGAQMEAAQRSNAASADDDLFNHDLWHRVRAAVVRLQEAQPRKPGDLH